MYQVIPLIFFKLQQNNKNNFLRINRDINIQFCNNLNLHF